MSELGRVAELWRYPVKGLLGERLPRIELDTRGVVGDRQYCVRGSDGKFGSSKTTRRFRRMPNLLSMGSSTVDGSVFVDFDDGTHAPVAAPETASRIGEVVGETVSLPQEGATSHFDDAPLHIITTASLAWLQARLPHDRVDRRRFRPNVVVDCPGSDLAEEAWLGRELTVGDARIGVTHRVTRCVTTALAQEDLEFAPNIPGELERANGFCLGVYATVLVPGTIACGDSARLAPIQ